MTTETTVDGEPAVIDGTVHEDDPRLVESPLEDLLAELSKRTDALVEANSERGRASAHVQKCQKARDAIVEVLAARGHRFVAGYQGTFDLRSDDERDADDE